MDLGLGGRSLTAGEGRRHGRGRGVRVSAVDWRQLLGFWSGRGRAEGTGSERWFATSFYYFLVSLNVVIV